MTFLLSSRLEFRNSPTMIKWKIPNYASILKAFKGIDMERYMIALTSEPRTESHFIYNVML